RDPSMTSMTPAPAGLPPHTVAAAAAHSTGNGMLLLAIVIIVVVIGWRVSLRLHPFTNCPACNGSAKHRGVVFRTAHRSCPACSGSGKQLRHGARGRSR
ncbi:MAG TPA: hypothetical protein VGD91_20045, partial [Trebonia sp.]